MRKKLLSIVALALSAVLIFTGCSNKDNKQTSTDSGEKISITHSLGTVEVPKNPKRIAICEFGTLDAIDKLGHGDSIVAVTQDSSLPSYIEKYNDSKYLNIGGLKELNMEKINEAQPDLIIIGGRQSDSYEELSKIAPVVLVDVDWEVTYMESVKKNMSTVGKLFDEEAKVNEYIKGFEDRISALNKKVTDKKATAVVSLLNDRSLSALGAKSRCSLISNELGFTNVAAELENSTHGNSVSWEYLVEKDPDYLFILDRNLATNKEGAESAKSIVENDMVKKTKAYKNKNIVYLTPEPWYLAEGGLYSTDLMISEIEKAFQ